MARRLDWISKYGMTHSADGTPKSVKSNEGILGDIKDAVMGKSAEEWAKTSTQMAALIKMRAQYPNNKELEQRINDLEFRLNQGSGEVMDYDPKTGRQFPKTPLPPKQ
jgi:hypothetical protein